MCCLQLRVENVCVDIFDLYWTKHTEISGTDEYTNLEGLPALTMSSKTTILLWMLHTELVAYELFTPLNLSLIGESVSLRCQSYRLREARGPLEEAVLCTSEDECRGLWLPGRKTDHESCICDDFPGTNFTPYHKLPFLHMKSVATAPLIGNEHGLNKSNTETEFWCDSNDNCWFPKWYKVHNSSYLLTCN